MSRDLYRHAILVCHANCKMSMKSDNRLELRPAMLHLLYFLRLLNYSQSDSDLCMIAGRCSSCPSYGRIGLSVCVTVWDIQWSSTVSTLHLLTYAVTYLFFQLFCYNRHKQWVHDGMPG